MPRGGEGGGYQQAAIAVRDGHEGVGKVVPIDHQAGSPQQAHEPAQEEGGDGWRHLRQGTGTLPSPGYCPLATLYLGASNTVNTPVFRYASAFC